MRAVNLIPQDLRRGGGAPTRSGVGVYVLIGGLGVLLVALTAWVLVNNSIKENQTKLVQISNQVVVAEARAARLKPYTDFSAMRKVRVETVAALAASRFNWDAAMRQTARVLPSNVWLTSLNGSIAPGAGGGGGGSDQLRQQVAAPALEIVGCTDTQSDVARVLSRLRQMKGVTRVSLGSSVKSDAAGGATSSDGGASGSSGSDCRNGSPLYPQFQIVVFFEPLVTVTAPASPAAAPSAQSASANGAAPSATQPASTGGTQ